MRVTTNPLRSRRLLCFVIFLCIYILSKPSSIYGWNESKHNQFMEEVLFGEQSVIAEVKGNNERNAKLQSLEYASFLVLDMTGNSKTVANDTKKLDILKNKRHVPGLPASIEEITLPPIFFGDHDNYTHKGWDYDYDEDHINSWSTEKWLVRRKILLSTVNKEMAFNILSKSPIVALTGYGKQCESFAKLIYYLHVLGDDISDTEGQSYSTYKIPEDTMPFAGLEEYTIVDSVTGKERVKNLDIASELLQILPDLFPHYADYQSTKDCYNKIEEDLKSIDRSVNKLMYVKGGLNTEHNYKSYNQQIEKIQETLKDNIPTLLMNEPFFNKVFSLSK